MVTNAVFAGLGVDGGSVRCSVCGRGPTSRSGVVVAKPGAPLGRAASGHGVQGEAGCVATAVSEQHRKRAEGLEPSPTAWKADVQPLHHARVTPRMLQARAGRRRVGVGSPTETRGQPPVARCLGL